MNPICACVFERALAQTMNYLMISLVQRHREILCGKLDVPLLRASIEQVCRSNLNLLGVATQIIVGIIIVAPVLWLAGRALVGGHKAKFADAVWIVVLGIVVGVIVGAIVNIGLLSAIIMFFVWLGLIKHFFDCGWLKAFAIAIVAAIIFVIIAVILAVIGIVGLGLAGL